MSYSTLFSVYACACAGIYMTLLSPPPPPLLPLTYLPLPLPSPLSLSSLSLPSPLSPSQQSPPYHSTAGSKGLAGNSRGIVELFPLLQDSHQRKIRRSTILKSFYVVWPEYNYICLQNPDYMKDGFHITIETIHVNNDKGQQANVSL